MEELGRKRGIAASTVRRELVKRGQNVRPTRRKSTVSTESIIELARTGLSQVKIAERLNISQALVSRRMTEAGVARGATKGVVDRSGSHHSQWKGGKRYNGPYLEIWLPLDHPMRRMVNNAGYVGEHRLVMAECIDRPLLPWETVHHIDGNPKNNELDNLQLRSGQHGKGVSLRCEDCGSVNIEYLNLQ